MVEQFLEWVPGDVLEISSVEKLWRAFLRHMELVEEDTPVRVVKREVRKHTFMLAKDEPKWQLRIGERRVRLRGVRRREELQKWPHTPAGRERLKAEYEKTYAILDRSKLPE
jgi:hypothetical protein